MTVENNNFSYEIGKCKTDTPWHRPDPYNLTLWQQEFFDTVKSLDGYKLWLIGACLEGRRTWDVDFIITGQLKEDRKLRNIMESMVNLGFKNRVLIDVWWSDDCEKYIEAGQLCKRMQIACQETIDNGFCTGLNCDKPRKIKEDKIVLSNTIYKNGKLVKYYDTAIKLNSGLWKIKGNQYNLSGPFFAEKHKKHFEATKYNKTDPILLTKETNFYNYIRWP